jgi:outer membrane protein assembly factor BamB
MDRLRAHSSRQPVKRAVRSVDASITIGDGRVLVLPLESDRIFCFDLLTGQALWPDDASAVGDWPGRQAEDALFIACVRDNQVVVVGRERILALQLDSGRDVWSVSLDEWGQPSGRGFLVDHRYFLPTSESLMIELDLAAGAVSRSIDTRGVLGNLICYKDALISQGFDVVSVYRQAEPVRQFVRTWLEEASPNETPPADILLWQAQLQAQDGDLTGAVQTADRAFQASGGRREKRLLMDLVLQLMESDYQAVRALANRYAPELKEHGGLRYEAAQLVGLLDEGNLTEVLHTLVRSGFSEPPSPDSIDEYRTLEKGSLRMRLDAWLKWRFRECLATAGEAGQAVVREWCAEVLPDLPPQRLSAVVGLLDAGYVPDPQWLRLAAWQIGQKRLTEAQRTLQARLPAAADEMRVELRDDAWATALQCRLLQEAGWQEQAATLVRQLGKNWPEVSFPDPWTGRETRGREFAETWLNARYAESAADDAVWSYGRVESRIEPAENGRHFLIRTLAWPEWVATDGQTLANLRLEANIQDARLIIRDRRGRRLGEVAYRDNPDSRTFYSPRMYGGSCALHGHLLIFAYGYDLIAVDLNRLKQGRPALLWQKNLQPGRGVDNRLNFQTGYQARNIRNPWGQNRFVIYGRNDPNPVGNFASNGNQVFCRVGNVVQCLDALRGDLIWQRNDLDQAGWLVADNRHVALLVARDDSSAAVYESAILLDAATGRRTATVDLSAWRDLSLWHSRGLKLILSSQSREPALTMFDLADRQVVWSRQWPERTHLVIRDPATMVLIGSDGNVDYVDTDTGQTRLTLQLPVTESFRSAEIMKFRDRDLILLSQEDANSGVRPKDENVIIRAPVTGHANLFNGWIHAVDRNRGQVAWQNAVRVEHFCVPAEHPFDTPLLTLNRLVYPGVDSGRGSHNLIEFYSLDLRDGRLVDEQRVRNWTLRTMEIEADPGQQTLVHNFNDRTLTLRLQDAEVPPAAPASLTNRLTIPKSREFAMEPESLDLRERQQQLIRGIRERNQDD